MKSVHLYHLYTSAKVKIVEYRNYEKILSNREKITNLGEREKTSLFYLVSYLLDNKCDVSRLDNFYYSYTIPHIGKEFDLLKIDNNTILNVELKSQNVGLERIKAQLLNNQKYLRYLNKKMYLFTFVSDSRDIYFLENNELIKCKIQDVLDVINSLNDDEINIDELFKASDYLVSPITNPIKFLQGHYFLTTQQEFIKNDLIKSLKEQSYFKITGETGTGKTLLLFDLAKTMSFSGKVFVLICNKLQDSHKMIAEGLGFSISDQENLDSNLAKMEESDYIFVDEAQRMTPKTWSKLSLSKKKITFSLDNKQFLTREEKKLNNSSLIDKLNTVKYKLSNKIRINTNITNFSNRLFDLSLTNYNFNFSNIEVILANNNKELDTYLSMYSREYTYIDILNYKNNYPNKVLVDDVLGNDYKNVVVVVDNNFYYNNKKLMAHNSKNNDYLYLNLLYQSLSRTREKLVLIIYKNKALFEKIINEGVKHETY